MGFIPRRNSYLHIGARSNWTTQYFRQIGQNAGDFHDKKSKIVRQYLMAVRGIIVSLSNLIQNPEQNTDVNKILKYTEPLLNFDDEIQKISSTTVDTESLNNNLINTDNPKRIAYILLNGINRNLIVPKLTEFKAEYKLGNTLPGDNDWPNNMNENDKNMSKLLYLFNKALKQYTDDIGEQSEMKNISNEEIDEVYNNILVSESLTPVAGENKRAIIRENGQYLDGISPGIKYTSVNGVIKIITPTCDTGLRLPLMYIGGRIGPGCKYDLTWEISKPSCAGSDVEVTTPDDNNLLRVMPSDLLDSHAVMASIHSTESRKNKTERLQTRDRFNNRRRTPYSRSTRTVSPASRSPTPSAPPLSAEVADK
jgi:hypothetical protein